MKNIFLATENLRNRKVIVVALSALVVFLTAFMLILPAAALDEETAESQGGIDVNVEETVSDDSEPVDAEASDALIEPDKAEPTGETSISDGSKTYDVNVTYGEETGIPEDALLEVSEIPKKTDEYKELFSKTEEALGEDTHISFVRFFDIKVLDGNGDKVEIAAPVDVKIQLTDQDGKKEYGEDTQVVHFADGSVKGDVIDKVEVKGKTVCFEADGFSEYAIVGTTIEKNVLASDGHNYHITVTCDPDAGIPEDADLAVSEILDESEQYEKFVSKTEHALGMEEGSADYIRLFDIKIVDKDDPETKYQPKKGTTVDVRVELTDSSGDDLNVVHFADENDSGSEVSAETDGKVVSFEASGFSVYAIVPGPPSVTTYTKVKSLNDLTSITSGFYIGHTSGYYLKKTTTTKSGRTYIQKTGQKDTPNVTNNANTAVRYYFEHAPEDKYYIYCFNNDSVKQYVSNGGNNSLSLTTDDNAKTAFTVEVNSFGVFTIHNGDWYWTMAGGSGGNGFASVQSSSDGNNSLYIWKDKIQGEDPYDLDGMTYGLMTWTGGRTAKALMANVNNGKDENDQPYQGCLEAKFLTVMAHEDDAGNKLYVPNNTADTVTHWTFEVQDKDGHIYYLKADNGKYLKITSSGLELVDEPDASCKIKVTAGTGKNKGKISLKSVGSGNKALTYSGKYAQGYNTSGVTGSEWLYLVTPESEDQLAQYEKVYSATKVSVSDTEHVYTGAHIIIYARQWKNDHYEYFAINSKGELVPCNESGDTIEWYGGNVNDMLWQFTEYVYEGTDTPNGYYELQNVYVRDNNLQISDPEASPEPSYLAPQKSTGKVLFDHTVGVLLQGRTDKQYYTPIVAWDNPEYMYSALTVDLNQEDPVLEPCYRADGLDFYFAIMDEVPVDDEIHTVPTVDNDQYGITMKMVDLSNVAVTSDLTGQMNAFLNNGIQNGKTWEHTPGLLSTNLTDGYPTTMNPGSGGSLANLYNGGVEVNHLFMDSTYRATGYYEYNSAQNFAHLLKQGDSLVGTASPDGGTYAVNDFVVYKELGTNDSVSKDTLKHGQFFPYNDIKPGFFASSNPENLYSATGDPLPDSDPRKHEQLYLVEGTTDYFFAMELEAGFVQTPNGLDAWGHDIIFEFSGDDDFWLYVDDELVIDLGGIHSAVSGTVNFRTGEVIVNPKSKQHAQNTTLYDLFVANYMSRGENETEAKAKADELFEENEEGNLVFKDNTNHTMRIFYMERGAGASNLHMKFNLAAVKKGTVELNKKLKGVSDTESTYALFPYQIFYTMEDNPATDEDESAQVKGLRNAFDPNKVSQEYLDQYGAESTDYVYYKGTSKPVTFLPEMEVDGVTYYNVFMLKPEDTAVINFPTVFYDPTNQEFTVDEYRIVECGIDPEVYTQVTVNDEINEGTDTSNPKLRDYGIGMATTKDRPRVNYVNKVVPPESLNITKELYKKQGNQEPEKIDVSNIDPLEEQKFEYRLEIKTPYDSDFSYVSVGTYHVKDPEGYYCRWDDDTGQFVRIRNAAAGYPNGTQDFDELTKDITDANGDVVHRDRFFATFETGLNGSMSGIPAYYTVEIRNLIPGTQYRVVERPNETPDGYKFYQYQNDELDAQGHPVTHTDPYDPWNGIEGSIKTDKDSQVYVKNYKGYGLRLEKVWEDATSIQDRDPAFFAVYTVSGTPETYVDEDGNRHVRYSDHYELVPGSVQRLAYDSDPKKQQLYWWYLDLPVAGTRLENYAIFEVEPSDNFQVDANGIVSGYESSDVHPKDNNDVVELNGTLSGQSSSKRIAYIVTYADPQLIGDNVLRSKVTNEPASLPPVRIVKADWSGDPLAGAAFTLKYGEDFNSSLFDPETKTSGANGLVARVFLQENVTYKLTELRAPQKYIGLEEPLNIKLVEKDGDWQLNVTPEIPSGYPRYYQVTKKDGVITLTVKNRPYELEAVKVDSLSRAKVKDASFSLYKQVKYTQNNGTVIVNWDERNPVWTGHTTDTDGVIKGIDNTLPAGTYQLRETAAPKGYQLRAEHVNFTIDDLGRITWDGSSLEPAIDESSGKAVYAVEILNAPQPLKLKKVDADSLPLKGAKFTLTTRNGQGAWVEVKDKDGNTVYGDVDMTSVYEFEFTDLPAGRYRLEETHAPDGYIILTKDIYFTINTDRTVELTKENGTTGNDNDQASISYDDNTDVYTITVQNIPGPELPSTGGPGTTMLYLIGGLLILLAGTGLFLTRRRRKISL